MQGAPSPAHTGCRTTEAVHPPKGWVPKSPAPAEHVIPLKIGLPQHNFHLLEHALYEVSHPDHVRYGAHLSKEDVEALIAPHGSSTAAVDAWLESHGLGEEDVVKSPAQD